MKKFLSASFFCLLGLACATPPPLGLTNLQVMPRYPWTGQVDITFDVACATHGVGYVTITAYDLKQDRAPVLVKTGSMDGLSTSNGGLLATGAFPLKQVAGPHHFVWDSSTDAPDLNTSLIYEIHVQTAGTTVSDATGLPNGIQGDVVVLDLDHIMNRTPSPKDVAFYSQVDLGTFNCDVYKSSKIVLRKIPAGFYKVGVSDVPTTQIQLTKDCYLGLFELTRQQHVYVTRVDESSDSEGMMGPVNRVTYDTFTSATAGFCTRLNAKLSSLGQTIQVRLPREVEWEIASRAGTETHYFFDDSKESLQDYAWGKLNANGKSHLAGQLKPNPWGFYDLYGNVNEFCLDYHIDQPYPYGLVDPVGPSVGSVRVVRGGSWYYGEKDFHQAYRGSAAADNKTFATGFRLAAYLAN